MPVDIRSLTPADQTILWEMLYYAIYIPNGQEPFSKTILESPDIARYTAYWGRQGDSGYLAAEDEIPVGAAWLRLMHGYGFVEEGIPELSIAVLPVYRGKGIGTSLLKAIINLAVPIYRGISLSVTSENPALHLYERFGFQVVRSEGDTKIMLRRLNHDRTNDS
jgi:[ribosomal protein S18]-alanine N-acetyltransferase